MASSFYSKILWILFWTFYLAFCYKSIGHVKSYTIELCEHLTFHTLCNWGLRFLKSVPTPLWTINSRHANFVPCLHLIGLEIIPVELAQEKPALLGLCSPNRLESLIEQTWRDYVRTRGFLHTLYAMMCLSFGMSLAYWMCVLMSSQFGLLSFLVQKQVDFRTPTELAYN